MNVPVEVSKRTSCVSRNRRQVLIVILCTQKKLLTAFFLIGCNNYFILPFTLVIVFA